MQIQFKGTNYELTNEMTDLAERKVRTLKKLLGKPEKPTIAYVDLGKFTEAHQSGAIWYAEINMEVNGERFNAKGEAETLRSAIDKMTKEITQELRAAKKKRESLMKRKGSRLKELFRFGS